MIRLLTLFLTSALAYTAGHVYAQSKQYTLAEILDIARRQSAAARIAETRKENRYWQYRTFRSNYNPQIQLGGSLPDFNRDYIQNLLDDGSLIYQERQRTNPFVNLSLEQPLMWTGGKISLNSNLNWFQDYLIDFSQWSGTAVNISYQQPLFGFNRLRWDRLTEPLRYEESKREYVQETEYVARQLVDYYFNMLDFQSNVELARFNLGATDTTFRIARRRFDLGTINKDQLLQSELQYIKAQQEAATSRIGLENARVQLRLFIGMPDTSAFVLILPEELPKLQVEVNQALMLARQNRADFIAFERRRLEAERDVAQARAQRNQITLSASFGLTGSDDRFNQLYANPLSQQRINIGFSIPVIDWGRNKAQVQTALAGKQLTEYLIELDEIKFEQEIITLVNQLTALQYQVSLSRRAAVVAQERFMAAQERYRQDKLTLTEFTQALNEKDNAVRSYVQALRSFWAAYFDLRRLTLYDFSEGKPLLSK
ncbi:MAG: TolC family protein [Cyclobacteriaceae bacterium]|nr:TolC family protein [Cyclobacteriaceae bacterium]